MSTSVDWGKVTAHLEALYEASSSLEMLFPGRKFTLDGHLVGSIGEVVAAYMFDLTLNPASTPGHDAVAADGRRVEVKLTQGRSIAIRHQPDHLLALCRPQGGPVAVIYNGPGDLAWNAAGRMQKNGQRPVSVARLRQLDLQVDLDLRLTQLRSPPV